MNPIKCWMLVDKDGGVVRMAAYQIEDSILWDREWPRRAPHRIIAGHFVPEEIKKEEECQ